MNMHRFVALTVFISASTLVAGDAPPTAQLERIAPSESLLQPPFELDSDDVDVAATPPRIDFAVYPGQWDGARLWSSWGDSLYASDGNFYASIGDHDAPVGTAYVYRINPKSGEVKQVVDYNAVVKPPEGTYSPGKIHGALVEDGEDRVLFFGYRGSVRRTTEEADYRGDWLLEYDLKSGDTKNLGIAVPFHSVPVLVSLPDANSLYGLSVPGQTAPKQSAQFFHYDFAKEKLVASFPLQGESGPRAMIVSKDGRAWFADRTARGEPGYLMRYDPTTQKVTKTETALPDDGTLRAASRPDSNGVAYCLTKSGMVFEFDTKTESITKRSPAFTGGPLYTAACRLDPTERFLYYVPGAHGRSHQMGSPLIQYDVVTGRKKVIAFLNSALRERGYNLGGTYGLSLNEDGSQVFINWNGSRWPAENPRKAEFGLCSAMIVHIPQSERTPQK